MITPTAMQIPKTHRRTNTTFIRKNPTWPPAVTFKDRYAREPGYHKACFITFTWGGRGWVGEGEGDEAAPPLLGGFKRNELLVPVMGISDSLKQRF